MGLTARVLSRPCNACPFKGRFDLASGRLKDIMDSTRQADQAFVCHRTIDRDALGDDDETRGVGSDYVHGPAAVCAGWLEAVSEWRPQVLQIAERLGLVSVVEPYDTGEW